MVLPTGGTTRCFSISTIDNSSNKLLPSAVSRAARLHDQRAGSATTHDGRFRIEVELADDTCGVRCRGCSFACNKQCVRVSLAQCRVSVSYAQVHAQNSVCNNCVQAFEPIGALVANLLVFGSSGHIQKPQGGMLQVRAQANAKRVCLSKWNRPTITHVPERRAGVHVLPAGEPQSQ